MKWVERRVGDVVIIDLKGKLTLGSGDVQLRSIIRDLLDRGEKNILLNLDKVAYMDSAGVGELVASYTTASNREADLKLLNLTSKIRDLLQFTQLISVFEHFSDETEGVASFKETEVVGSADETEAVSSADDTEADSSADDTEADSSADETEADASADA